MGDPAIRPRMHAYLATVCRDSHCEAYRVGGPADHVHMGIPCAWGGTGRAMNRAFSAQNGRRPRNPGRCPGLV